MTIFKIKRKLQLITQDYLIFWESEDIHERPNTTGLSRKFRQSDMTTFDLSGNQVTYCKSSHITVTFIKRGKM